jgi:D-sedoheptulose 7-phosphate isomerase
MSDSVSGIFRQVGENLLRLSHSEYLNAVAEATKLLADAFDSGAKLLVFGNGGSSADAQHIAAELVGRFAAVRPPLSAIALGTNSALLTAWSNDTDFSDALARELEALGQPGDVVWGISTSGNSPNVVNALERARGLGLKTIGMTGESGGKLAAHCDVLMAVPLAETPRIQEVHVVTYHAICAALEERLLRRT